MLVDADCDLNKLATVLVADVDAVLAGVFGSDFVDEHAGKLAAVKCSFDMLVGGDFLLVLEPGDLRGWLAPYGASQAQRLQRSRVKSSHNVKLKQATCKIQPTFQLQT